MSAKENQTEYDVALDAVLADYPPSVGVVLRAIGVPPDLPAGTVEASLQCVADLVRRGYACYPITDEQAEALRRLG